MKDKILIGSSGTGTAFGIISNLKYKFRDKVEIYTMDMLPKNLCTSSIFSEKHFQVPKLNDKNFEKEFAKILLDNNISTFIPILNEELLIAYTFKKREEFEHIDFWSSKTYANLISKEKSYKFLNKVGVEVPYSVYSYDEFLKMNKSGSIFIKPKIGIGSKDSGVYRLEKLELDRNYFKKYLLQEVCVKPEITVDSFYDPENDELYIYCRERIEVKSGVSVKVRLFFDEELYKIAKKIALSINQVGAICFQVMLNQKNNYVITDLNLRTGAGTNMTCSAGFNILSANYALRKSISYQDDLRKMESDEEYFITRQYTDFLM
jgi:carbamoylphosphate synthase large subunit